MSTLFYKSGGTLGLDAESYVARRADEDLFAAIQAGEFCYILDSRQVGKSSLMAHTKRRLEEAGVAVAAVELTALGISSTTPEQWYDALLAKIGGQLGLEDALDDFWFAHQRLAPLPRLIEALRQVVLERRVGLVAVFLDEIDVVRSLPFATDELFAGIRELYNRRTQDPALHRLSFCLIGVAQPTDLIQDPRITPFNIGRPIELTDFTLAEAAPLARGLPGETRQAARLLDRVLYWTGGHPYLTHRLCQAVAEDGRVSSPRGVDRVCEGLFFSVRARDDEHNLKFVSGHLLRAAGARAALLDLYRQIHERRRVHDDPTNLLFGALRLAGIVRTLQGLLRVRNRIYFRAFDRDWIRANLPDAEVQRQRAAYRRGALRVGLVTGVVIAILLGAIGWAYRAERGATLARNQAEVLIHYMLFDLQDKLQPIGRLDLLDGVSRRAVTYFENLPVDWGSDDSERNRSVALNGIGDVRQAQGDLTGAREAYEAALRIRERLAKQNPANAQWQRDLSVSHTNLGDVRQAQGDLTGARAAYEAGLTIRERLATQDRANAQWQRDLSISHLKLGDVRQAQVDLAGARAAYEAGLAISERLAKQDPANAQWQRDLSASHERLGDVRKEQGDLASARAAHAAGLTIRERLAKQDPANAQWQRDLSISHERLGDVRQAQGDLAGARAAYEAAFTISERLAKQDPANAQWQRGLSVNHNKLGDVRKEQGDLTGARAAHEAGLTISERLTKQDPANIQWQRDLSISHERLGDVRQAQGDLTSARAAHEAGLTIRERLVKQGPANAQWQRDLSISHLKLSEVRQAQGDLAGARAAIDEGVAVARELYARHPDDTRCHFLAQALGRQSFTLLFNRQFQAAIAAAEEALALDSSQLWIVTNQAHGYLFAGQFDKARALYLKYARTPVNDRQTFSEAVLDDFQEFRKRGLDHPDINKIKALLIPGR